jgi:hypothetical protein
LWELRNKVIHGKDVAAENQLKRRYALQDLTAIYELRDQLLPCDRDILMSTYAEHALKSTNQIKNGLHIYKPTIIHSIHTAKKHAIIGVRSISSYFTPTTTN